MKQTSLSLFFFFFVLTVQSQSFTLDQINSMISEGQLTKETNVWKEGMANWGKADDQEELKGFFGAVPPPPPK